MPDGRTVESVLRSMSEEMFTKAFGEPPVSVFSRKGDDDTPLHVVCWRNDVEAAEILLRAGADVNALGDMEETPLHVAIRKENEAMVRVLLAAGARTDIRSQFGRTPADMAVARTDAIGELVRAARGTRAVL